MEHKDTKNFERFINEEMSAVERQEFEARLVHEPELREALRIHLLTLNAILLEGRTELKRKLGERTPQPPGQSFWSENWQPFAGALLVFAVLFLWWYFNKGTPTPSPEPQTPTAPLQQQSKPIESNQPVAQTPVENPPASANIVDGAKLFAANFRAYRSEDLKGMLRSEETPDAFQLFLSAYLRGEYAKSLKLFENLPEEDRKNENILFLKANALLADKQTDAGIALLENLEKGNMFSYTSEARWYLALARLKKGDTTEAKKLLELLAKTPRGPYQSEASKLLREM